MVDPRLDRLPQFDERSRSFPIRSLFASASEGRVRSYTWRCDTWLDQGQEGACVGHGVAHEIAARPVVRPADSALAFDIYHRARQLDEWEGESYEGTSVLAGMKAATEKGFYTEYRWAFGLEDVVRSLGYKGPVVLGVNWYSGMFSSDDRGIHPRERRPGGRALSAGSRSQASVPRHEPGVQQRGHGQVERTPAQQLG